MAAAAEDRLRSEAGGGYDREAKPKATQAAAEAYISDKGIKAVLEAAINVDRPIVDLSAMRTGRSRQPAIAEARLGSLSKLP